MLMMLNKKYSGVMGRIFPVGDMRVVPTPERCSCFLNNDLIKEKHCTITEVEKNVSFEKLGKLFENK